MSSQAARPGVAARAPRSSESGQGLVEFALILIMVSVVAIVILISMGAQINNMFSNVVTGLNT